VGGRGLCTDGMMKGVRVCDKISITILKGGRILAAPVALEIDDISRLSGTDKLCAYAGVPATHDSGGKIRHGNLLPACNRWLRRAYVEAAWIAQRTSPYCHACFERIKRRKGANRANTALARRLCEITWHCTSPSFAI
jgi:transposase